MAGLVPAIPIREAIRPSHRDHGTYPRIKFGEVMTENEIP